MAFRPITEAEAQALTRRQLLQRVEETQAWLDRPPRSAAKRAADVECSRVMHAHLSIGAMLDSSLALVQGQRGAGAGYLDERVDGPAAHPGCNCPASGGCRTAARTSRGPARTETRSPSPSPATRRYPCSATCLRTRTGTPTSGTRACGRSGGAGRLGSRVLVPGPRRVHLAAANRLHLALAAAVLDQDDLCHADVLLRVANGGRP
jgi:hypothetical protein